MVEFMKFVDVKQQTTRLASSEPEPVRLDEVEALADNLRSRGIIDDKGLVKRG